jgi:uncharacterized protein (TIGR04255 family)
MGQAGTKRTIDSYKLEEEQKSEGERMPFPHVDRFIYDKNPLVEVICQFRFPEILAIEARPPVDFQEQIRNKFPIYEKASDPPLPAEIRTLFGEGPGKLVHKFITDDKGWEITLSNNFLALTANSYKSYEPFKENAIMAVKALKSVYAPAFLSRIGLRYKDLIIRSDIGMKGRNWAELLKPSIISELKDPDVGQEIRNLQKKVLIEVEGGHVQLIHGFVAKNDNNEQCYLIDADFYSQERTEVDNGIAILNKFNELARRLLRWAIEDELHKGMAPKKI